MTDSLCPIWGTPAEQYQAHGDYQHFDSARAGGQFKISRSALAEDRFKNLDPSSKARLTTWIVNQRRGGIPIPLITAAVVNAALTAKAMKVTQKIENFFNILHEQNIQIEDEIIDTRYSDPFKIDGVDYLCEIKDSTELTAFAKLLISMNIFNRDGRISLDGIKILEKYANENLDSKQVFVAMWFDTTMNDVYDYGFEPGIQSDTGLAARRIDRVDFLGKIDDEILAEIRRSKFVVADFTCGETVRGGVYYEAGFAQALGKQVIFTCRADQIQQVHFDTRQFNHILWQTPADLQKQLNDRIKALGLAIA